MRQTKSSAFVTGARQASSQISKATRQPFIRIMAHSIRACRALLFMHRCRQSQSPPHLTQTRNNASHASSPSPYDPSNFSKPMHRTDTLPTTTSPFTVKKLGRPVPPPTETVYPGIKPSIWNNIKMAFGWRPKAPSGYTPAPFNAKTNPYHARKSWPPDFSTLHSKHQFHFEKTYRRRAKLAYARPKWNRRVKTLQHTGILLTVAYFVFICEPEDKMGTPFDGFRAWFFGKMKNLGTLPEGTRAEAEKLESEARETMKSRRTLLSGGVSQSPMAEEVMESEA